MKSNNRWWENYLVRYLVGNFFAILIIFYIFINYDKQITNAFYNDTIYNQTSLKNELYSFLFQTQKTLDLSDYYINEQPICKKNINNKSYITITELTPISFLILVIFGFVYMYISSIPIFLAHIARGGIGNIYNYYFKLSKRKKSKYKESYKHLREHGNAYGIILMEILFASYLIFFDFKITSIILWLSFGFIGWFLGIYLEKRMVKPNYKGFWFSIIILYILFVFILFLYLIGVISI